VDTFLVEVYCLIDDVYREHGVAMRSHLPGRPGELSDSEVLTLAVLAQWQASGSERQFIRWAVKHWRSYFPRLLSQSAFNRRVRHLYGVLARLSDWIRSEAEAQVGYTSMYEVIDGVAVPLMRQRRGRAHRCFGVEADFGHGGSDGEPYYGVKALMAVDAAGFISGCVVGPASTEEHWLAEALFRWRKQPSAPPPTADELAAVLGPAHRRGGARRGPNGPLRGRLSAGRPTHGPTLADAGFHGDRWRAHWRATWDTMVLLASDYLPGADQRAAGRWFNGLRYDVETTFSCLEAQFRLKFPRARTFWGLLTRLAAKLSAYNIALAINLLHGRPGRAFINPLA
jgi:hypothetical protein